MENKTLELEFTSETDKYFDVTLFDCEAMELPGSPLLYVNKIVDKFSSSRQQRHNIRLTINRWTKAGQGGPEAS